MKKTCKEWREDAYDDIHEGQSLFSKAAVALAAHSDVTIARYHAVDARKRAERAIYALDQSKKARDRLPK